MLRLKLTSRRITTAASLNPFKVGSDAHSRLEKCIDHVAQSGKDLFQNYEPSYPVELLQTTIVNFEHLLPLGGWPLALTLTAVAVRLAILPIQLWSMRKAAEAASVSKKLSETMDALSVAMKERDQKKGTKLKEEYEALSKSHGRFFALKGLAGGFSIGATYITALFAVRGLAEHPNLYQGLALSDPLWLNSLCLPDPLFLLPALSSAVVLTNFELTGKFDSGAADAPSVAKSVMRKDAQDVIDQYLTPETRLKIASYGKRSVIVGSLYFTTSFPSACFFFFIPMSLISILQMNLLKRASLQTYFRLTQFEETAQLPSRKGKVTLEAEIERIKIEMNHEQMAKAFPKLFPVEQSPALDAEKPEVARTSFVAARKTPQTLEEIVAAQSC